jgi:hypothetical protein
MHHMSEPPDRAPTAHTVVKKPCSGGHLILSPGQHRARHAVTPG